MSFNEESEAIVLLDAVAATGAGDLKVMDTTNATFQATNSASSTGATVVDIEVSNDNAGWIVLGTITLSGANDTYGIASSASWKHARANVTTWTDGTVTVTMGG